MPNFFEIFALDIKFNIDKDQLLNSYFKMQKQYHPDNSSTKKEQLSLMEISSNLNIAFKTLESDLERAIYLLKLNNIELENYASDQNILENIWRDYEDLDNMSNLEDLKLFHHNRINQRNILVDKLDLLFKTDLIEAGKYTMLLKYLNNLLHNIKVKINQLTI